jgi:hypothetical protein
MHTRKIGEKINGGPLGVWDPRIDFESGKSSMKAELFTKPTG